MSESIESSSMVSPRQSGRSFSALRPIRHLAPSFSQSRSIQKICSQFHFKSLIFQHGSLKPDNDIHFLIYYFPHYLNLEKRKIKSPWGAFSQARGFQMLACNSQPRFMPTAYARRVRSVCMWTAVVLVVFGACRNRSVLSIYLFTWFVVPLSCGGSRNN